MGHSPSEIGMTYLLSALVSLFARVVQERFVCQSFHSVVHPVLVLHEKCRPIAWLSCLSRPVLPWHVI